MTAFRISKWNETHPNLLDLMVALLYITENGIKCFPICRIDILSGNFIGFIFFEIYQITAIWYILTLTSDFCGFSFCFFAPVLKGAVRYPSFLYSLT